MNLLWRLAVTLLSGLALALSFPPVGWSFLAPLAIAGITVVAVRSRLRGAFGFGLLSGLVFWAILLHWMATVGDDAWLLLSLYCALWLMFTSAASWCVAGLPGWPAWIAAIWVLQEALRDRVPLGGFPWGRLAFSQAGAPDAGYAALGGAPLVTFIVAVTGALLAWAVLKAAEVLKAAPRARRDQALIGAAVGGSVLIWIGGLAVPLPVGGQDGNGPAQLTAAVIQGSVPNSGLDAMSQRQAVLNNHVAATIHLADEVKAGRAPAPQFVIWPENSSDLDPLNNGVADLLISQAADAIGVPILVGAVTRDPANAKQVLNIGLVWEPVTGPGQMYVKRHPVPFGEYLPARDLLSKVITRFDRIPYDFTAGSAAGILQVGPALVGDVICFEVADDQIVREAVTGGGRLLTVQTNNATYTTGPGWGAAQPEQQFAMARLRAIEHGRTVLVAATSGVSAIIAPDGSVVERAPLSAQDELVASVAMRDSLTVSDHLQGWPELAVSIAALGGIFTGIALRVRVRRAGRKQTTPPA